MTEELISIEKIESLNFEVFKKQLNVIFNNEEDIVAFINFFKNVQRFVSLSNDKRHNTLIELAYFKSQITLFEKRILCVLNSKKSEQNKIAIKKAKGAGEKITENTIGYYNEASDIIQGLEEVYNIVSAWNSCMCDIYYMCGQTNKNLGNL